MGPAKGKVMEMASKPSMVSLGSGRVCAHVKDTDGQREEERMAEAAARERGGMVGSGCSAQGSVSGGAGAHTKQYCSPVRW